MWEWLSGHVELVTFSNLFLMELLMTFEDFSWSISLYGDIRSELDLLVLDIDRKVIWLYISLTTVLVARVFIKIKICFNIDIVGDPIVFQHFLFWKSQPLRVQSTNPFVTINDFPSSRIFCYLLRSCREGDLIQTIAGKLKLSFGSI